MYDYAEIIVIMAAAAPPIHTVLDAIIASGVDNVVIFGGATAAARIATDLFDDSYVTVMDKTWEELETDFKSYTDLTQAEGRIRLLPGIKRNLKGFIQWVRDEFRLGRNPENAIFPIAEVPQLVRRHKTHKQYVAKAKTIAEAAKPAKFTLKTKWDDWNPSFQNFLRSIPGKDGVPLKYVCRENDMPDPTPHADFLDDYIAMAPLVGEAYVVDAAEVHTYLVNFIAGNTTAESKIQMHANAFDGRLDFKALQEHFEGVGINSVDIVKADKALETLFYSGEKKPHMWWEEFEMQLTTCFTIYDRKEARVVHSNEMKLRILCRKVNADFLAQTKAAISIEMTRLPVTLTYEQALSSFRNEVNRKFPPEMSNNKTRRHINAVDRHGREGGRDGGRGRGGRFNPRGGRSAGGGRFGQRGRGNGGKRVRADSVNITLTDGKIIEAHPSFNFTPDIWAKIQQHDRDTLVRQREEYKRGRQQQNPREIQYIQVVPHHHDQGSIGQVSQLSVGQVTHVPGQVQLSQVQLPPQGGTIMGGRNEQSTQGTGGRRG
jgi:hypothetical protein